MPARFVRRGKTHKSLAIKASLVTYVQSPWIGSNQQTLDGNSLSKKKETRKALGAVHK